MPTTLLMSQVSSRHCRKGIKRRADIFLWYVYSFLQVTCSQGDVSILMKIVHENLGEGFDPEHDSPAAPPSDSKENNRKSQSISAAEAEPVTPTTPANEAYTRIRVEFKMETLEAVLYNGDSQLQTCVKVG